MPIAENHSFHLPCFTYLRTIHSVFGWTEEIFWRRKHLAAGELALRNKAGPSVKACRFFSTIGGPSFSPRKNSMKRLRGVERCCYRTGPSVEGVVEMCFEVKHKSLDKGLISADRRAEPTLMLTIP